MVKRKFGKVSKSLKSLCPWLYEFLIKKCEDVGIEYLNDEKTFTDCSTTMEAFKRILMIATQTEKEYFQLCLMTWLQMLRVKKKFQFVVK